MEQCRERTEVEFIVGRPKPFNSRITRQQQIAADLRVRSRPADQRLAPLDSNALCFASQEAQKRDVVLFILPRQTIVRVQCELACLEYDSISGLRCVVPFLYDVPRGAQIVVIGETYDETASTTKVTAIADGR